MFAGLEGMGGQGVPQRSKGPPGHQLICVCISRRY